MRNKRTAIQHTDAPTTPINPTPELHQMNGPGDRRKRKPRGPNEGTRGPRRGARNAGRPPDVASVPPDNAEERIERYASQFLTRKKQAALFGVSIDVFRRWMQRYPKLEAAAERGAAQAEQEAVESLQSLIKSLDIQAIKFALSRKCGWIEPREEKQSTPEEQAHRVQQYLASVSSMVPGPDDDADDYEPLDDDPEASGDDYDDKGPHANRRCSI